MSLFYKTEGEKHSILGLDKDSSRERIEAVVNLWCDTIENLKKRLKRRKRTC